MITTIVYQSPIYHYKRIVSKWHKIVFVALYAVAASLFSSRDQESQNKTKREMYTSVYYENGEKIESGEVYSIYWDVNPCGISRINIVNFPQKKDF